MTGESMIKVSTAVFNKYFRKYNDLREDLINEGVVGIIKGLRYFSEQRGSFGTFVFLCAKRNMLIYLKKEVNFKNTIASDYVEDVMNFIPDESSEMDVPYNPVEEINKLREIANTFSGKRKEIANDLLDCNAPKELVAKYGVTKQRISQIYVELKKRTLKLYKFEDGYLIKRSENDKEI